jgi:uncharacterized protein YdcH (DUF465 family)
MNITLRKANAVQLSINEMVKGLSFDTSVSLNEFEDAAAQIDAVRSVFDTHSATRTKLVGALYEIRKAVAVANADAGINDMLAEVAMLEKEIQFYNTFATKTPRLSDAVIAGKMEKIKGMKDENRLYGRYDTVDTGIFNKEEIEFFKRNVADLKRQKQKLQDTLLELNVQTEIQLDEETARFLERADIL